MKKIKSLNKLVLNDIYIEKLEEKVDLSRISAIDLMIDSVAIYSSVYNDTECDSYCGAGCNCYGDCGMDCADLCIFDKNLESEESETSNPNPWEDVWSVAANSSQTTSK